MARQKRKSSKRVVESTDKEEIKRAESEETPASEVVSALILPITADLPTLHRLGQELRRQGFFTSGAGSIPEAVRRIRDLRPDLVLLDPLTPGMDGRDILRDLGRLGGKSLDGTKLPPLLLASPHLQDEKLAAFHDDIALLPTQAVSCDGLSAPLLAVLEATGDAATILYIGSDQAECLETALQVTHGDASLTIARTREELEVFLQSGAAARRTPDVVLVGTDANTSFDLGTWRARLRRKHPNAKTVFILLIEDAVFEALDLRMLAPPGVEIYR